MQPGLGREGAHEGLLGTPDVAGQSDCDFFVVLSPVLGQQDPRGGGRAGEWSVLEGVLAGYRYRSADGAAGRPGVLEGMLATALRCCGLRELQISDSGV
jgi:hypothetical protein